MREKLVLAFLFILTLPAFGQHHIFRRSNALLPSPECYRILQDNRGFVWIATEQGFCRFDGQNTKVYGPKEGMHEKGVYALRKDEHGLIWLLTKKGRVLNLRDDQLSDAGFKQQFGDPTMTTIGYDFVFLKKSVFIPVGYSTAFRLNRENKSYVKIENKRSKDYFIHIEHREGQVVPLIIFKPRFKLRVNVEVQYTDKDTPSKSRFFILPVENSHSSQIITSKLNERVFFGICSRLVEIGTFGELKIHRFPNRILSMLPDSRGGLWVGILGYGVYYYANGDFSRPPIRSLPGLSVSNIMEDREKHIWCTTLEKGVYICQQPVMLAFNDFDGLHRRPDVMTEHQGGLLISTKWNEVIVIDSLWHIERLTLTGSVGEYMTAIKRIGDQWAIGYREMLAIGTRKGDIISLKKREESIKLLGLQFGDWRGLSYVLSYRQIFRYKQGKIRAVTDDFSLAAKSFLVLGSAEFLIAMPPELRHVAVENGKTSSRLIAKPPATISRLFRTKSKRVFMLTKGEGLFELCGGKMVSRNQSMHIPTKVLNDMAEDRYGNLWIASNEGLLKLPFREKGYGKPLLYDERHGFPSRVCEKLAIAGKMLAVSTTEGLITFPVEYDLQSEIKPGISFHKATVSGKSRRIQKAELKYNENSILLHFSVQSYHRNRGQLLRFSLDNGSFVQRGVSGTLLSLKNLDPGNYRLTVFGQNSFGIISARPLITYFTILPPFWLTWWFVSLCLLFVIVVLLLSFRWIRKRTERRAEMANNLKMQLVKSQLSTLQAQMNPHFLFNSISSIQNFIMSNRREEAYDYLTSFSKLIRRTLNNSRSQYISLAEEIETLKLYMLLEQRRYNDKFDFHLELDETIVPENTLLPSSLIQPLLENAIWHGVAGISSERRGEISLRITEASGSLSITVVDNGAGVQPSVSAHKSLAITLIEEQLSLLSGSSGTNQEPSRVELKPAENGQGTAVSFTIPLIKRNENTIG
jgi:ligand-binding sensor domain-containing protein